MMVLNVGTRGSKLSLAQTDYVISLLRKVRPDLVIKKTVIQTSGDIYREKVFSSFGVKGIFEKEIDAALVRGDIDFAVHSLKDVPSDGYSKLVLAAIPKRESPNDVLVSRSGEKFTELKPGSVVGTSSPRRMIQTKFHRSDLRVKQLRGNVETRLNKVSKGDFDAIIIAEAGVKRLGMSDRISERLPLDMFTPAPGQGALVVVTRKDDKFVVNILAKIDHLNSRNECAVERFIASKIGGGCQAPIGVIARQDNNSLSVYASVHSPNGRKKIVSSADGKADNILRVGKEISNKLIRAGAATIIDEWRKKEIVW